MSPEEGRWLEGLDERTERERMEEAQAAPERLDDAEREALTVAHHGAWHLGCDGRSPGCCGLIEDEHHAKRMVPAVERIVTQRVARAVAEAKAEAWDEGADWAWTEGQGDLHADNPYRADREGQP